jgi:hypothetical protein
MDNNIWEKIINDLKNNPRDLQTIPINNRIGKWFYAEIKGEVITLKKSQNKKPSSKFINNHYLKKEDFDLIYPIYIRRKAGEKVSNESKISFNRVYIYSILYNCGKV